MRAREKCWERKQRQEETMINTTVYKKSKYEKSIKPSTENEIKWNTMSTCCVHILPVGSDIDITFCVISAKHYDYVQWLTMLLKLFSATVGGWQRKSSYWNANHGVWRFSDPCWTRRDDSRCTTQCNVRVCCFQGAICCHRRLATKRLNAILQPGRAMCTHCSHHALFHMCNL